MKILKIELDESFEEPSIVVTVEGYSHAKPVFLATITEEELKIKLEAWRVNQDAVDAINEAAKIAPKPVPVDISELKKLEGKEIFKEMI